MTRLVPDRLRRRWTDAKIEKKRFSCSTFMMYLGIEGRYDDLAHHTIYMPRTTSANLADIETRHVLSDDPSFYVQNACVTDPTLAPPGMSTLYVLVPVTHQHAERRLGEGDAGVPRAACCGSSARSASTDVERRIRFERIVTPADWENELRGVHRGATFNLAHNLGADAAPAAAQPLRGPGRRLPGRRRHAPGQRAAGDLRVGPHHVPAAARATSAATPAGSASRARRSAGRGRGARELRFDTASGAVRVDSDRRRCRGEAGIGSA